MTELNPNHPAVANAGRIEALRRQDPLVRRRHLEVRAWALARGMPIDRYALTIVLATLADGERLDGIDCRLWTADRIIEFVWGHCYLWCAEHDVAVPPATADTLAQWWSYVADTDGFATGSDDLATLLHTLRIHSGSPRRPARKRGRQHIGSS